jgi:hypothetical protein
VKGPFVKSKICFILLFSSLSAYATDVPIANLIVTVHKNCNTGTFSALSSDPTDTSDYQLEIVSQKPLQCDTDAFLGKPLHFNYQLAADGTITLTKTKRFFLGKNVSIAIGSVDIATMCDEGPVPPNGLVTRDLVVSLLPTVRVNQDIELSGGCVQSAQIMSSQPYTYNRSFTNTVTISDSNTNASLSLSMGGSMLFTDMPSCQNLQLP